LSYQIETFTEGQARLHARSEVPTTGKFTRKEELPILMTDIVDGSDMWMSQCRHGSQGSEQAGLEPWSCQEICGKGLDRCWAIEA
jgi:hypothetical protein